MKKYIVLFIFLMLFNVAYAIEDVSYSEYADISLKVDSSFNLGRQKNTDIEYIIANLSFVPVEYATQNILEMDTFAIPSAEIQVADSYISYRWGDIAESKGYFGLNAKVRTTYYLPLISKKVEFPIKESYPGYDLYTESTEYIDINEEIINIATNLSAGETDLFVVATDIARWVKENIRYEISDETMNNVLKSSYVISTKRGVCDEISNVFISLMRSIKVPARFVSGVVYSDQRFTFGNHGWAEIYFPEYGWVPFDVTFGQFGYLDPSHLKFKETKDSGESALHYSWKSYKLNLSTNEINVKTGLIEKGNIIKPLVDVSVTPLFDRVGFGSYVPIRVTLRNTDSIYVPLSVFATVAPEIMDGTIKYVIMKPNEIKDIFYLVRVSSDLDKGYIYTSGIVINTSRGGSASTKLEYASHFNTISNDYALDRINENLKRENKEYFTDLKLDCTADREIYYSSDYERISCKIMNIGTKNLDDLHICIENTCENKRLTIGKSVIIEASITPMKSVLVTADTENNSIKTYVNAEVINTPIVMIMNFTPMKIDYNSYGQFNFTVLASEDAQEIIVKLPKSDEVVGIRPDRKSILSEKGHSFNYFGTDYANGKVIIELIFKDKAGKEYTQREIIEIDVANLPWYWRTWIFARNIFS